MSASERPKYTPHSAISPGKVACSSARASTSVGNPITPATGACACSQRNPAQAASSRGSPNERDAGVSPSASASSAAQWIAHSGLASRCRCTVASACRGPSASRCRHACTASAGDCGYRSSASSSATSARARRPSMPAAKISARWPSSCSGARSRASMNRAIAAVYSPHSHFARASASADSAEPVAVCRARTPPSHSRRARSRPAAGFIGGSPPRPEGEVAMLTDMIAGGRSAGALERWPPQTRSSIPRTPACFAQCAQQ